MTAPDLRTAVRAAIRDVERRVDTCPGCDTSKAHGVHGKDCSWKALRSALTAEATEPPPDDERVLSEARRLMRSALSVADTATEGSPSHELLGQLYGDLCDLLVPDPGSAPNPQGADERCRVSENGSVSHRWACDFGPDCPAPGGVMHDPQGAEAPTPPSPELERQRGYSAGWHAGFREGKAAATGGVPDEPGDDDFPTTAAVLDSLEDIEQFHDDADMQTAAGVARLALIGYRDRYAELLAEVERLRAEALFVPGDFVAHSGDTLRWKIECDALTDRDWEALALAAIDVLPPFGGVEGVPTGGDPFARALAAHSTPGGPLLIADDVCTTGTSLDEHRAGRDAIGVVAFARGPIPDWVTPLFTLRAAAPASEDDRWVDLLTRADERANPDEERMYADEDADLIQELAAALRVGSPPPTPAPEQETTDGR